jgi:hypothetical protein
MLHVTLSGDITMAKSVKERVQKRRSALRNAGLRPIQLWVPDTHKPGFEAECCRQSQLAAKTDAADKELLNFMDEVLLDVNGWTA